MKKIIKTNPNIHRVAYILLLAVLLFSLFTTQGTHLASAYAGESNGIDLPFQQGNNLENLSSDDNVFNDTSYGYYFVYPPNLKLVQQTNNGLSHFIEFGEQEDQGKKIFILIQNYGEDSDSLQDWINTNFPIDEKHLVSSRDVSLDGVPGIERILNVKSDFVFSQFYLKHNKVYLLSSVGLDTPTISGDFETILNNFHWADGSFPQAVPEVSVSYPIEEDGVEIQAMPNLKFPFCATWQIQQGYNQGSHQGQWNLYALDWANRSDATWGAPLYAAHRGFIIYAQVDSYGSKTIVLRTEDGTHVSMYGHLNNFAVGVGSFVNQGDIIGWAGDSGTSSAHLHFSFGVTYGSGAWQWNSTPPEPMSGATGFANWQYHTGSCPPQPRASQIISYTIPTTMITGQQYQVSVTMKNIGTLSWSKASEFKLGDWPNQNTWTTTRAYLSDNEVIAPEQTKTFTFTVTAPAAPGTYNFQWRMLQENVTWFGPETNVNISVQARPARDALIISQSVPTTMVAGQTYPVSITMKNTGSMSWTENLAFRLGSGTENLNTWGIYRAYLSAGETIATNQQKTFTFNVTAPATPGSYTFRHWQMVQENVTWFGPQTTPVTVTVVAYLDQAEFVGQSPYTTTVSAGSPFTISYDLKNNGTSTWTPGSFWLQNMNNTALMGASPQQPITSNVAPGQTYRWVIAMTAPATPSSYRTQWAISHNGAIFGPPNAMYTDIIVQPNLPGNFIKTWPTNQATGRSLSPTLQWNTSSGANSYEYCYSSVPGPCTKWNSVGANTSIVLSGLAPNTTYYWQVQASNPSGTTKADTGTWWSFTTVNTPINTWPPYTPPGVATFADVPSSHWAWNWIERLYSAGITGGCSSSPLSYCPEQSVTRAQMAIFLLRGIHGSSYTPPLVGDGTGFTDVPVTYWASSWIKQFYAEGITGGCGNGGYCPDQSVTRAQMAIFLLRAKHGSNYAPPAVSSTTGFGDVAVDHWAASWIKQLAAEGITGGCGNDNYCPEEPVTRTQMAIFLVRAFGLP